MYQEEEYHTIRIEIFSSPETRDDEVRFIADGIDLIGRHWSEMMGLSPDDVLIEPCRLRGAATPLSVTIARCGCGIKSCASVEVNIQRSQDHVVWECAEYTDTGQPAKLYFPASTYDAEVERALRSRTL